MELELKENESALVITHHQEVGSVTTCVVSGGILDSLQNQMCYAISEKLYGDNIFWKEVLEDIETQKISVLSKQVKRGGMATLTEKIDKNVATLVFENLKDGRMAVYMGTDNKYAPPYDICKALQEMFIEDESFREHLYSYWDEDDEELPEIPEIQEKKYRVREFPIFHRFLVTLFHREQLAIRLKYKDLFRRIGEYEVKSFCDCDCYWCGDIVLKRDITLEKSEFIAFDYPDCSIRLTFDPDGTIDMVNLSGLPYQFPFFLEVRDVMDGRVITYDKEHAQMVVDKFFKDVPFLHKTGDVFSTMDYQVVGYGKEEMVLWKEII